MQHNFNNLQFIYSNMQHILYMYFRLHVKIIISDVDLIMLHVSIIVSCQDTIFMLHVDINKLHVNIIMLHVDM